MSRAQLEAAVAAVDETTRPKVDTHLADLLARYTTVRRFLPALLTTLVLQAAPGGTNTLAAFTALRDLEGHRTVRAEEVPLALATGPWIGRCTDPDGTLNRPAYTFLVLEPGTGAAWAEDGEVVGTAAELRVEHQERQAAEVIAVQVGDQHRLDLVEVDLLLAQRGQAGRSAVQQHAGYVGGVGGEGDTGREPATGAERIPAAHRRHTHDAIIPLPGGSRKAGSRPVGDSLAVVAAARSSGSRSGAS